MQMGVMPVWNRVDLVDWDVLLRTSGGGAGRGEGCDGVEMVVVLSDCMIRCV